MIARAASAEDMPSRPTVRSRMPIVVADTDLTDIVLRPSAVQLKGRIVRAEGDAAVPATRRMAFFELLGETPGVRTVAAQEITKDGTFVLDDVTPGRYRVVAQGGWDTFLRRVTRGVEDVTDSVFEVGEGVEPEITIELTSRMSRLSGDVIDAAGKSLSGASVVAFSTTPERWQLPRSRYVAIQESDADGKFEIRGLPAGDYFVAVTDIDESEFGQFREVDPEILEHLRASATQATAVEGQTTRVSLRQPAP